MAEPVKFPLVPGPSNEQRARIVDYTTHDNRYLVNPGGAPKADPVSYLRPALRYLCNGIGPVRAMFELNGRAYFVGGAYFYEFDAGGNVTQRGGPMVTNGNPATIDANAVGQIAIVSGGEGYIFEPSTNVFSNITSTVFPTACVSIRFLDSFFLGLSGADGRLQPSGINDGFTWSAANFIKIADFPEQVLQTQVVGDNIALFGSKHSQVWWANGNAALAFAPLDGGLLTYGIEAVYALVTVENSIILAGRDAFGSRIVWMLSGAQARVISTPAMSYALSQVESYAQAQAFAFRNNGDGTLFYVLYVPGLNRSLVYNLTTATWDRWGHWKPEIGDFIPFRGVCGCYAWGKSFCGDRLSGAIYELTVTSAVDRTVVVA